MSGKLGFYYLCLKFLLIFFIFVVSKMEQYHNNNKQCKQHKDTISFGKGMQGQRGTCRETKGKSVKGEAGGAVFWIKTVRY